MGAGGGWVQRVGFAVLAAAEGVLAQDRGGDEGVIAAAPAGQAVAWPMGLITWEAGKRVRTLAPRSHGPARGF